MKTIKTHTKRKQEEFKVKRKLKTFRISNNMMQYQQSMAIHEIRYKTESRKLKMKRKKYEKEENQALLDKSVQVPIKKR